MTQVDFLAWRGRSARSQLNEALWAALKEKGITIAFLQVDVHFDRPVAEGLAFLASGDASG